ncbi:hypothetical protein HNR42_000804 [Deinobacterium chartae]|uniref:DUF2171 domain-containing protein n=1 Tax=Deinobacterium chartae TaxID=521158 RepID=A0A841HYU9_9DEIO|nr:DUF2171 domain-containing protein [Deinobacterium chartae]MBB6097390.1 hypothetical protein [Deinobacterium chartae]
MTGEINPPRPILPGMPVVCDDSSRIGRVVRQHGTHLEVELAGGEHRWLPMTLVSWVDRQVRLHVSPEGAARRWLEHPPRA